MNLELKHGLLIERICDAFELECRTPNACAELDAVAFLESHSQMLDETVIGPELRDELLMELWRVQLAHSARLGAGLSEATLRQRYPDKQDLIERLIVTLPDAPLASGVSHFRQAFQKLRCEVEQLKGKWIGPYELCEHLGSGGMGSVWHARQVSPVKRDVALKLVRPGYFHPALVSRFKAERQALAVLEHPNIARMLDAGESDLGQPYLVMELVRGPSITSFCSNEGLDVRQRIELLIPVCAAIQHAHQKGMIHRDLKPSNILVATGDATPMAKVIDLGLVKTLDRPNAGESLHTSQGQIVGSLDYMSPEQTRIGETDIDTRADIYALGAVLYQLLTGCLPLGDKRMSELPFDEAVSAIRHREPVIPSKRLALASTRTATSANSVAQMTAPKAVAGDLDWIAMKCLEKDRSRRYESAAALAADLQRFLDGSPVEAVPPSRWYRTKKFVAKNRGLVAAASAVFTALLVGLIGTGMALQWALAEREKAGNAETKANQRADDLQQVTNFQATEFLQIDPSTMGTRIREALVEQRRGLLGKQKLQPEEMSSQLESFEKELDSTNFTDVGLATLQQDIFDRLQSAIDTSFASRDDIRLQLLEALELSAHDLGSLETALNLQSMAVELRQRLSGDYDPRTLKGRSQRGLILHELSRYDKAHSVLGKCLDDCRRKLPDGDVLTIETAKNLARNHQRRGEFEDAESLAREANNLAREFAGPTSLISLQTAHVLGQILSEKRKFDEAETILKSNMEMAREILPVGDQSLITSIGEYGLLLERSRRYEEAQAFLSEAV